MTRSRAILVPLLALCATLAAAQISLVDPGKAKTATAGAKAAAPAPKADLLPPSFGGWKRQSVRVGADPAQFDAASAAALKEYGFTDFALATYVSRGRSVQVKAARFADASGAFGTFSFLRQPGDKSETIGDAAAVESNQVLFYSGNVLIEADSSKAVPPVADLRALAESLPRPVGAAANLPSLLTYLPKQPLNSVRYFAGPVAATTSRLPLNSGEVRWDDGAEVVWAQRAGAASATDFVLISYPTPQMAAARLRDLEAAMVKDQVPGITRLARRSGPIVVWVSGAIAPADAQALASSINYDANVTWNEPNPFSKRENVGGLVVAALALAGIVLLISLAAGLAFGGLRILMKRLYPDKFFDRAQDVEIIRLHLSE